MCITVATCNLVCEVVNYKTANEYNLTTHEATDRREAAGCYFHWKLATQGEF